ncbi:zinc-binding alcohol dehydrogenase family protein [Aspergillus stella-maris]|uniref:zinc-binding alcohol dehydrogenase family protein n=1 Tax=Aspergillus stella-maris TaxID=1810926 RepID=UPI003CCCD3E0
MPNMKEAIVHKGPAIKIVDTAIPTPQADQVLIKVVVSGTNPKDWKLPEWLDKPGNQGDDIAGIVEAVGDNVTEFKKGDRVMAFHEMVTAGGSYAEYAIAWQHTTAHLPKHISFEEAATIPLAALTSVAVLYHHLALPEPWRPATSSTPLVIYGGASAIGAYAIQLAQKSNIHPVITVAGRGAPFVEKLIDRSKGDTIIDYRKGDEAVVSGIKEALKGAELFHSYDCVSEGSSFVNLGKILAPKGKLVTVLPGMDYPGLPEHVDLIKNSVGCVHEDQKDLGYVHFRFLAKGLLDGWFKPHPHEVISGGLVGLETALSNLKNGKASATKYVVRVGETEGVSA